MDKIKDSKIRGSIEDLSGISVTAIAYYRTTTDIKGNYEIDLLNPVTLEIKAEKR